LGLNKKRREEFQGFLALLELGLENRLEDPVKLLSGGQRQALTLLMATLGDPEILLLDEYTANLDPKTAVQILEITGRVVEQGKLTVLMVTHDLKQALEMGNRTIMMDQGRIILDLKGEEREKTTVNSLLEKFSEKSGRELTNDRMLLRRRESSITLSDRKQDLRVLLFIFNIPPYAALQKLSTDYTYY